MAKNSVCMLVMSLCLCVNSLTIDEGLTEQERSQMLMVKRMLEEHLYWIMVNDKFVCC